MTMPKKRAYNSELRQAQARVTKDRILVTARIFFESNGFEKVTIEDIAKKAEVSAPTIYALFQSKIGILRALIDEALSPGLFEELVQKAREEKSPSKHLKISASIARHIYDAENQQLGTLQNASILDPEFKKLEIEREKRRYLRQEESVKMLAKENSLVENLSVTKARDILWAFTGRDLYRMLVLEQGWSSDEYEVWLAHLLVQTLLKASYY
jgi:AcrR family transcriptional regulator